MADAAPASMPVLPELPIGPEEAYAIISDPARLKAHPSFPIMGAMHKQFTGSKSENGFHMELPYDDITSFLADTKEKIFSNIPAGETHKKKKV